VHINVHDVRDCDKISDITSAYQRSCC